MPREQFSVPNFASLVAREELEDAACYYPATESGMRPATTRQQSQVCGLLLPGNRVRHRTQANDMRELS